MQTHSDIIDSRELIEEIDAYDGQPLSEVPEDERERVQAIRELEGEGITDWQYGATLIPTDEFEDYAQQLAEDIGAIPEDNTWPLHCIDWEQAASELAMDYSVVTFEGNDYYVRS